MSVSLLTKTKNFGSLQKNAWHSDESWYLSRIVTISSFQKINTWCHDSCPKKKRIFFGKRVMTPIYKRHQSWLFAFAKKKPLANESDDRRESRRMGHMTRRKGKRNCRDDATSATQNFRGSQDSANTTDDEKRWNKSMIRIATKRPASPHLRESDTRWRSPTFSKHLKHAQD